MLEGHCAIIPADKRGLFIQYREGETNYCPGCGRTHWYVGRTMAECAFCTTALELPTSSRGEGTFTTRGQGG